MKKLINFVGGWLSFRKKEGGTKINQKVRKIRDSKLYYARKEASGRDL